MSNNGTNQDKNFKLNLNNPSNQKQKTFLQDNVDNNSLYINTNKNGFNDQNQNYQNSNNKNSQMENHQANLNLMRNHTESDVSYEGNIIDMVRIINKKQEGRRSRINIRRKQYQKYQNPSGQKYPRLSADRFTYELQSQPEKDQNFSTIVHTGTAGMETLQNKKQRNTILLIQDKQQKSNIVGIIIIAVFVLFAMSEFLICSVYLNQGQQYENQNSPFIQENLEDTFIERHLFVQIICIYMIAQIFYTILVYYLVLKHPQTGNRLVDKQTSSYKYIKHHRTNQSSNFILRSARFKVFTLALAAVFYFYSMMCVFFTSQLIYLYSYFKYDKFYDYSFTTVLQILYFGLILPQIFRYLFLDKIVSTRSFSNLSKQSIKSQCTEQPQPTIPIKDRQVSMNFNFQKWWMKLSVLVFLISIFYSLCFDIWLGVAFISKSSIYFFRVKHRIDSFYIQQIVKILIFVRCVVYFVITYYTSEETIIFLGTFDITWSILLVFVSICLSRIIARIYLKQQLYKYFYNEMNFLTFLIIASVLIQFFISQAIEQIYFTITDNILIVIYNLIFILILVKQGGNRTFVNLNFDQKRQSLIYQMQAY